MKAGQAICPIGIAPVVQKVMPQERPANERRYNVTMSVIGWAHT